MDTGQSDEGNTDSTLVAHQEVISLQINPGLFKAIDDARCNASYASYFVGFSARYQRAKKALAKQGHVLPRNTSQWNYAARELLRATLSDYDFGLLTGSIDRVNSIDHYYVATHFVNLNHRYTQAVQHAISQVQPALIEQLPFIPFTLGTQNLSQQI